ncbi:hypothetical protein GCM10007875_25680 [Limnobacter litoralis]|uniref:Uncharacterized protein n=1 Tax=Limnobacter litoralis TaxID=481366 RepID=A0ABQ5YTW6_9BURK|nr:hypothetical protein GCM10007875_25680 [Limnobacter litoralis]
MKPKPFESLNHFTVPVVIFDTPEIKHKWGVMPRWGDSQEKDKRMKGKIPRMAGKKPSSKSWS